MAKQTKQTKLQKALQMYNKKLEYQRSYQKNKYEKLTIAIKKDDIIRFMKENNLDINDTDLYDMSRKYLVIKKLKEELQEKGFIDD